MKAFKDINHDFAIRQLNEMTVLSEEECSCGEMIQVVKFIVPFGPNKGNETTFKKGCKCEEKKLEDEMRHFRKNGELHRMRQLFEDESLVNDDLMQATFHSYKAATQDLKTVQIELMKSAQGFDLKEPHTFILTGTYGVGKSHLAYAYSRYLLEQKYSTLFLSVPKLLTKIKSTYNKSAEATESELLDFIASVDLLVLDDIGAEHQAKTDGESWAQSKLFEIIDSRVGKHNIYTTNLEVKELQSVLGNRNFSRVMQRAKVFKMVGPDYRLRDFQK